MAGAVLLVLFLVSAVCCFMCLWHDEAPGALACLILAAIFGAGFYDLAYTHQRLENAQRHHASCPAVARADSAPPGDRAARAEASNFARQERARAKQSPCACAAQ